MDGRRLISLLLVLACTAFPAVEALGQKSAGLPLVLEPASAGTDGPLVLLISGDGNWAQFPRAFADAAAGDGAPVVGLKARDYMQQGPVTPERLANDLAAVVRKQLAAWNREDIVVVGYSRGADWMPFVLNRWPEDLRKRVQVAAFVGLSRNASFEFHFDDLFRDVKRPTDVPERPEVQKLVGLPMICVYGDDVASSFCTDPVSGMKSVQHAGGHRVKDDEPLIAYLLGQLGIGPKAPPPNPSGSTTQ